MIMGTRGFLGFVLQDKEYITYNHYDSYPSGLGDSVLQWLRAEVENGQAGLDSIRQRVAALQLITNEDAEPTPEEAARLAEYADLSVSTGEDWYSLLRNTQGDPEAILTSGYMIDGHSFPLDSLFCEWGYLVDLDRASFDVYRGFQNSPATAGRWAGKDTEDEHGATRAVGVPDYYAVQLIKSYPLADLPEDLSVVESEVYAEDAL
jgi:hypothetical protein